MMCEAGSEYDRIDLFGLSYGSRAVLVYMRQHPDRVHAATIAGVVPTYLKMPLHHSEGQRAPWTSCFRRGSRTRNVIKRSRKSGTEWTTVLVPIRSPACASAVFPPDKSGPVTVESDATFSRKKLPPPPRLR